MDYGIYTTQGKKVLLGNRATVNGRDAIAYVKNGHLQSYAYMDDFASQFVRGKMYLTKNVTSLTHRRMCEPA